MSKQYCRSQGELREWYHSLYGYDGDGDDWTLKSAYDLAYYHTETNVLLALKSYGRQGVGYVVDQFIRAYHKGMQHSPWGYDDADPYLRVLLVPAGVKDLDWRRPEPVPDELNAMIAEG